MYRLFFKLFILLPLREGRLSEEVVFEGGGGGVFSFLPDPTPKNLDGAHGWRVMRAGLEVIITFRLCDFGRNKSAKALSGRDER